MHFRGSIKIDLHDAVLERVEVVWGEKLCRCMARPVGSERKVVCLVFSGVTAVHIPHSEPWGPSGSILSVKELERSYVLEMQSGDSIEIVATEYEIVEL